MDICKEYMFYGTCSMGNNCPMHHIATRSNNRAENTIIPSKQSLSEQRPTPLGSSPLPSASYSSLQYPDMSNYPYQQNPGYGDSLGGNREIKKDSFFAHLDADQELNHSVSSTSSASYPKIPNKQMSPYSSSNNYNYAYNNSPYDTNDYSMSNPSLYDNSIPPNYMNSTNYSENTYPQDRYYPNRYAMNSNYSSVYGNPANYEDYPTPYSSYDKVLPPSMYPTELENYQSQYNNHSNYPNDTNLLYNDISSTNNYYENSPIHMNYPSVPTPPSMYPKDPSYDYTTASSYYNQEYPQQDTEQTVNPFGRTMNDAVSVNDSMNTSINDDYNDPTFNNITYSPMVISRMKISPARTYPSVRLILTWTLPESDVDVSDWIGLFRDQQYESEKFLTIRRVNKTRYQRLICNNIFVRTYSMSFHAPKSVGKYNFRYYRAGGMIPLLQSNTLLVQMRGRYLSEALSFLHTKMDEDIQSCQGIRHLALILKHLTDLDDWDDMDQLVEIIKEMLIRCFPNPPPAPGSNAFKQKNSLHGTSAYLLHTVLSNELIKRSLTRDQLNAMYSFLNKYCWICEEFFGTEELLKSHLKKDHNMEEIYTPESVSSNTQKRLTNELKFIYKKLYPGDDFITQRQKYCESLEKLICDAIPALSTGHIYLYGSSGNGFGNASCDIDISICLETNSNKELQVDECFEEIVKVLETNKMVHIDSSRLNARVPIIQYDDPSVNLSVDLGINNQLPVRNTALLRVYAMADPRVRILGLTIKRWAKSRMINDPTNCYLSSYGYILMLIHFLQSGISPPLLPILQDLPPDWDGSSMTASTSSIPLPKIPVPDVEGVFRDTYFFNPKDPAVLRRFASKNPLSVGSLLCQFFYFYGYQYDFRHSVINIRYHGDLSREDKVQSCSWTRHGRMSIEDPFENQYDIAHVLNEMTSRRIREEMIRAYQIICQATADAYPVNSTSSIMQHLFESPATSRKIITNTNSSTDNTTSINNSITTTTTTGNSNNNDKYKVATSSSQIDNNNNNTSAEIVNEDITTIKQESNELCTDNGTTSNIDNTTNTINNNNDSLPISISSPSSLVTDTITATASTTDDNNNNNNNNATATSTNNNSTTTAAPISLKNTFGSIDTSKRLDMFMSPMDYDEENMEIFRELCEEDIDYDEY
ncbi:hypothetical protein WA158_002689 [Blastocystis sp. Blastoise]